MEYQLSSKFLTTCIMNSCINPYGQNMHIFKVKIMKNLYGKGSSMRYVLAKMST